MSLQPPWEAGEDPGNIGKPSEAFLNKNQRSVSKLEELGFDPIEKLVSRYKHLESDAERLRKIRNGEVVEVLNNGRNRNFSYETMTMVERELIGVATQLLRYKYARVPETQDAPPTAPPVFKVYMTPDDDDDKAT